MSDARAEKCMEIFPLTRFLVLSVSSEKAFYPISQRHDESLTGFCQMF